MSAPTNYSYEAQRDDYIKDITKLYAIGEMEDMEYQTRLATRNIQFGKKLLELEKLMKDNNKEYDYEIVDCLTTDIGKQIIDVKYCTVCKTIASIENIEQYIYFGWNNFVCIYESTDRRYTFNFKKIFNEIDLNENDMSPENIYQFMRRIKYYRIYKKIKNINSNILFKTIYEYSEKGIDFNDKRLQEVIRKSNKRPDRAIMNYANGKKININSTKHKKRTLLDDIEILICKSIEALKMACENGKMPKNVDPYLCVKFIQEVINFDKLNEEKILVDMINDDETTDELAKQYVKEILS